MSCALDQISIIIPAAAHEPALDKILDDLKDLNCEIIVSFEGTRAKSLNAGAAKAQRVFLWFLHADSVVTPDTLKHLQSALINHHDRLHYFDLAFDAHGFTALNAWGANMRSRLFGTPFGDQGFCISKDLFDRIGGYPEDVPYGEDLMFVWKARQASVQLNRIPTKLITSARKYKEQGWFKLTALYQWRWIGMSLPELYKMMKAKR